MDLSSLPNYPRANPPQQPQPQPATDEEPAASRRWGMMFLQLAIIAGVWAGIYTLNQQSRNIAAGFARDEAKRKQAEEEAKLDAALVGKWQSTHGEGTILELRRGVLTLTRDGRIIAESEYDRVGDTIQRRPALRRTMGAWGLSYSVRYQVSPQELVIWGDDRFRWVVLGRDPRPDEPRPLEVRFRRIGD